MLEQKLCYAYLNSIFVVTLHTVVCCRSFPIYVNSVRKTKNTIVNSLMCILGPRIFPAPNTHMMHVGPKVEHVVHL